MLEMKDWHLEEPGAEAMFPTLPPPPDFFLTLSVEEDCPGSDSGWRLSFLVSLLPVWNVPGDEARLPLGEGGGIRDEESHISRAL